MVFFFDFFGVVFVSLRVQNGEKNTSLQKVWTVGVVSLGFLVWYLLRRCRRTLREMFSWDFGQGLVLFGIPIGF